MTKQNSPFGPTVQVNIPAALDERIREYQAEYSNYFDTQPPSKARIIALILAQPAAMDFITKKIETLPTILANMQDGEGMSSVSSWHLRGFKSDQK